MAEIYLSSSKVHVFPCANRNAGYDLESKLNTEYNLINLPTPLISTSSFTIDKTSTTIRFVLHGYYFEADFSGSTVSDLKNIWANCSVADSALTENQTTKSLCCYNDTSTSKFILDKDTGEFKGIIFDNADHKETGTTWVQLTDGSGNLVSQKSLDASKIFGSVESAENVSKTIDGKPLSEIFEYTGTTPTITNKVKEATKADNATNSDNTTKVINTAVKFIELKIKDGTTGAETSYNMLCEDK